jgi:hypothetical protein
VQTSTVEPALNYAAIDTAIKVAGPRAVPPLVCNDCIYLIKKSLVFETEAVKYFLASNFPISTNLSKSYSYGPLKVAASCCVPSPIIVTY